MTFSCLFYIAELHLKLHIHNLDSTQRSRFTKIYKEVDANQTKIENIKQPPSILNQQIFWLLWWLSLDSAVVLKSSNPYSATY